MTLTVLLPTTVAMPDRTPAGTRYVPYDPYSPLPEELLDAEVLGVWGNPDAQLADAARRLRKLQLVQLFSAGSDNAMVSEALNYLGIRYRFGGSSPDTGFDCSGLVTYSAERSLGLKLPRNAAEMAQQGISVAKNELKAGDLVFFNTMGRRYSHVGIYLGDDRFVHSPSAGGVVRVESMTMAYWTKRYNGARRLDNSLMASARAAN